MFPNKDWNLGALKVQTDTTGTVDRHLDSGRPHTVCTIAVVHQVEDLSLSQ